MRYSSVQRTRRISRQTLTPLAAAVLLTGFFGATPRAYGQDKSADTTPPRTERSNGTPVIGDDNIDPNQPLKPEFTVSVTVLGEPEPSGTYIIDPAGNIGIKYTGIMTAISVKGLTPKMAADEVAKYLKTYIKNPQVTVTIVAVPRPTIFVGGAVKNPGPIIVSSETTLVDVLSRAQWTDNADLSQVRITRREKVGMEDKQITRIVNFEKYIKVGEGQTVDEAQNPLLKDKDRIFVGFKVSQGTGVVAVGGEVLKPAQNIPLRTNPPMTVREIINLVGGTNPQANRKNISIRRPTLDRPLVIDLDKAEQGDLVNNIEIRPDDAIYVEKLENNAYINLNGGFVKQGRFVYDKRTTLSQAIMEAGGPAPFSRIHEGKIFRHPDNDPKSTQVIPFNWKKMQDGKAPDIELQPGDSVWITPGQPPQRPPFDLYGAIDLFSRGLFIYNQLNNPFGGVNGGFGGRGF